MALRTPLTVSPHMYIGDSTGRPLDNGMIYFGEPDKDPEFYPINIFSDDDLTIPVSQPVRSKGGYLNDNKGDMAEIHAKELIYSVKVLDQYGRKIFYKGQSMRSNWNDDVIIRIDEALMNTAAEAKIELDKAIVQAQEETKSEARIAVQEALDTTVVGNGGVSATLVVDNGKTQRDINNQTTKMLTESTLFLSAERLGLVKWSTFKKPPYSALEYEQAYNNGIILAKAAKDASDAGILNVVLERGNYPICYSNLSGATTISPAVNNSHATIDGTNNLNFDGNGSCLFVIFDSGARSPYDNATALAPYQLMGVVFCLKNNTNLTLRGFEIRGDQYNRTWVTGEKMTEQTYGIFLAANNINTTIDIVGHGFRGDAVSGNPRGGELYRLDDNWELGGLDRTTGATIVETGAYRSPLMDLSVKTIYRNAVQVITTGVLRAAEFRNEFLSVFFYDTNNAFLSRETTEQCEFIYLPPGCRYIRFVAYGDERTAPIVGYGNYLFLASGCSEQALVKGEYFANHRGAVSNLCGYTTVDANIHDNGTNKYGFPDYGDPTRYGINFEDIYVSSLIVKGSISNGIQAIYCNSRSLKVEAIIKNIQFSGVGVFSTYNADISKSTFENVGNVCWAHKTTARKGPRVINFDNCIVKNSSLYENYEDNPDILLNITNNTFTYSRISLRGNGSNVVFDNNTVQSLSSIYQDSFVIANALSYKGNTVNRAAAVPVAGIGWSNLHASAKLSQGNVVTVEQASQRTLVAHKPDFTPALRGVQFLLQQPIAIPLVSEAGVWLSKPDKRVIENCEFKSNELRFGTGDTYAKLANIDYTITDTKFTDGASLVMVVRETATTSVHKLTFKNCTFDMTKMTSLVKMLYATASPLAIKFFKCTFEADTAKSLAFLTGDKTNVTMTADYCRFINVTNTDGTTVITN